MANNYDTKFHMTDQTYNTGNMYGQQTQTQPEQPPSYNPHYQQPIQPQTQYVNPQYQQEAEIQSHLVHQQHFQPVSIGTPAQFADEQPPAWEECVVPAVVSKPEEPCQVHGFQDGIGFYEGCVRNPHLLSWVLTIGVWYMIATTVLCLGVFNDYSNDEGYCGWFHQNIEATCCILAVIIIVYLIECLCTATSKYLSHILTTFGAKDFVANIRRKEADISWHVSYYIWIEEKRTVYYSDDNGNNKSREETSWRKEYIHRANISYTYSTCYDISCELLGLDVYNVTKLKFNKIYGFADNESRNDYCFRKKEFRNDNWRIAWVKRWNPLYSWHIWGCYRGHRGWMIHEEFHERFDIDGYTNKILAEAELGSKPKWMTNKMYWMYNLLFISPIFRHRMSAACGNAEYTFIKQISIKPMQTVVVQG
eukprot:185668_1